MIQLLALAILAAEPTSDSGAKFTRAVEIYSCDFEESSDRNYDQWPDRWTRRRGKGFPHYVKIGIQQDQFEFPRILPNPMSALGDLRPYAVPLRSQEGFLQIALNGGSAVVSSPMIEVNPMHSYVLEAKIRTEKIHNNKAYFEVAFYDDEKTLLEQHTSKPMSQVDEWLPVVVGPITPQSEFVKWVRIRLHLRKDQGGDLFGKAMFDDVWLGQLPRMNLTTEQPFNVYNNPQDVEVDCEVSGISEESPRVLFELFDVRGERIDEWTERMPTYEVTADFDTRLEEAPRPTGKKRFSGRLSYQPPTEKLGYGFFRIRASMLGQSKGTFAHHRGMMMKREITFVVMRPMPAPQAGEFGWTLPDAEADLPFVTLANLLQNVGVNWVKFPVWYGEDNHRRAEDLAAFAERLSVMGIEMIGLLDHPPKSTWKMLGREKGEFLIAAVFEEDALWRRVIDPVLTRLSLKVRWWQLGADDDLSFVGFPSKDLNDKLLAIREHMERFGQEVKLGVGWNWLNQQPTLKDTPLEFVSLRVDPPFTGDELQAYLQRPPKKAKSKDGHRLHQWVQLKPLDKDKYNIDDRAIDLVSRMLAAKMKGADGIFVPNPFDPVNGLMNRDGTPGELLLPWRTTAFILAGAEYLGEIQMPNGSRNSVFVRDGKGIMAVWNDHPIEETLYLGQDVVQIDLWGRQRKLPLELQGTTMYPNAKQLRQTVRVDRYPSFLVGINPEVAAWRIGFRFAENRLSSMFGQTQQAKIQLVNPFPQGVGGNLSMRAPAAWQISRPRQSFRVGLNETGEENINIKLGTNASSGSSPVQIDFEVTAARTHRFSVFRELQVGRGDVTIELSTSLAPDGSLIVEQTIENKSDQRVSFNCYLFPPKGRRLRLQVLDLERGRRSSTFVLPNGKAHLGKKIWLRAEEIYGQRILNYQVVAEE